VKWFDKIVHKNALFSELESYQHLIAVKAVRTLPERIHIRLVLGCRNCMITAINESDQKCVFDVDYRIQP
jgi:hypothetical protein